MTRIVNLMRRAGGPYLLMTAGFVLAFAGLGGDYYEHEIAGFSPALESFFAPVHVMIFTGIIVAALGFLWGMIRVAAYSGPEGDWAG